MKTRSSSSSIKKEPGIRISPAKKTSISYTKKKKQVQRKKMEKPQEIPDVLYTATGAIFYPCKHCCRAFARKRDMLKHSQQCSIPISDNAIYIKDSASDEELNNNIKDEDTDGDVEYEAGGVKVEKHKVQTCVTISTNVIPNSINTFDLKTKAKIVKNLNRVLGAAPVAVTAMENGDVVVKFDGTANLPHSEAVLKKIGANAAQISMRRLFGEGAVPTLKQVLEEMFGENAAQDVDQLLSMKVEVSGEDAPPVSLQEQSDEVILVDEDEIEDMKEEMHRQSGEAIVLEDLDIHICKQCGAVYQTLDDLVNHDKYEHRKFKKRFSAAELARYEDIFKRNKDNVCPICMKKLKHKWSWARHYQMHSEVPEFQCTICKKKFTRNDHRKNHEKRHLNVVQD